LGGGHCFTAGLHETDALRAGYYLHKSLSHLYLQRVRIAKYDAVFYLLTNCVIDGRVAVAQRDWAKSVAKVDVLVPIQIPYPEPLPRTKKHGSIPRSSSRGAFECVCVAIGMTCNARSCNFHDLFIPGIVVIHFLLFVFQSIKTRQIFGDKNQKLEPVV
jgi:hypothetical protein